MKSLAQTVLHAFRFLELSGEDVVDLDVAVKVMEMLAADLQDCSHEEKAALAEAAHLEYEAEKANGASEEVLEFYHEFIDNLFIDDE